MVPLQNSGLKLSQSNDVRKDTGNKGKISLGLLLAAIAALIWTVAAPGFALFIVFGTTTSLALLVYVLIAVTSRHRVADSYADYIKPSLTS